MIVTELCKSAAQPFFVIVSMAKTHIAGDTGPIEIKLGVYDPDKWTDHIR